MIRVEPGPGKTTENDMTTATATVGGAPASDLEILQELNSGYIRSVEFSDVRWFDDNLADDFLNTNPDRKSVV